MKKIKRFAMSKSFIFASIIILAAVLYVYGSIPTQVNMVTSDDRGSSVTTVTKPTTNTGNKPTTKAEPSVKKLDSTKVTAKAVGITSYRSNLFNKVTCTCGAGGGGYSWLNCSIRRRGTKRSVTNNFPCVSCSSGPDYGYCKRATID